MSAICEFSKKKAVLTFRTPATSTGFAGVSASTCSSRLGNIGLVARRINNWIPDFRGLFLPDSIETLCHFDQGMVLLAGVTGSGKSTTIGSMLNYINSIYRKHILTLEDPIEFIFTEDKSLINQREIGQDVKDFGIGMKHAVREDPDIILVGELRDEETFMTAIHAAETGHLVFGTIHASSAATTIGRILGPVPGGNARRDSCRHRLQHEGHRRPKIAQEHPAGRLSRADVRSHDVHSDDYENWCSRDRTTNCPTRFESVPKTACRTSR